MPAKCQYAPRCSRRPTVSVDKSKLQRPIIDSAAHIQPRVEALPALHLYARQGALRLEGKRAFWSLPSSQLPSAREWNGRPQWNLIPKYSSSSDKHANTLLWSVCTPRHATVGNKLLKLIFHRPFCARQRRGRLLRVTARTVGFVCAWSHPECNSGRRWGGWSVMEQFNFRIRAKLLCRKSVMS